MTELVGADFDNEERLAGRARYLTTAPDRHLLLPLQAGRLGGETMPKSAPGAQTGYRCPPGEVASAWAWQRRLAATCGQGPASTVTKSRIQPLRYWSAGRYWSGTAARSGPPGDCAVSA
jgi:hypothetical protein